MIFITAIISLGIGLALGGFFWGHYADSEERQAEEIAALQEENARVRSQACEFATQLFEDREERDKAKIKLMAAIAELDVEASLHNICKRELRAAKRKITTLRKALGIDQ